MAKKTTDSLLIGLDAKRAVANGTGLGNYSRYAINMLSLAFGSSKFRLYSPTPDTDGRLKELLERPNVSLVTPPGNPGRLRRAYWRTLGITKQLDADEIEIYHGLSNEVPLNINVSGIASVVTIHDIIYRRYPDDYKSWDRHIYDFKYRRSAEIASRVIAISECTKRDIISDYDINPETIDVIYQGVDPIFSLKPDTLRKMEVKQKYGLPDRFILAVGTLSPRKNQLLAVSALEKLPGHIKLVLVGSSKQNYKAQLEDMARRCGVTDRIMLLENVPFKDLPLLYALAGVSSYTSFYEGFGLPVVESLSCGTPVIAATGSCLEEAGGDGAVYIDPNDADAYAAEALKIFDDLVHHDRMARRGSAHIKKFSADNFARKTMGTYKKALIDNILV